MSKDKNEGEEKYRLTPLGVIVRAVKKTGLVNIYDDIIAHMERHGYNGILLENGELTFIEVKQVEESESETSEDVPQ